MLVAIIRNEKRKKFIVYRWGGQTFCTKGRIETNFEAEGRTAWKSEVKPHMSYFPPAIK